MISEFDGEYHFLSNFSPCRVLLDGFAYNTTEAAYQAAKTLSPNLRLAFQALPASREGAKAAKKMGKTLNLRPNWDIIKIPIMKDLLEQKFRQPHFRNLLLDTHPEVLVEGNWWKDTFWGQCPLGNGENWLGKLLMEIRAKLVKEGWRLCPGRHSIPVFSLGEKCADCLGDRITT